MDTLTVFKKFDFHAAHTLPKVLSEKCANMHGHTYHGTFFINGPLMGDMVIEASALKCYMNEAIDLFDHAYIVGKNYEHLYTNSLVRVLSDLGHKLYFLGDVSTVENIAPALLREICTKLEEVLNIEDGIYTCWLELYETDTFGCITNKVELGAL